MTTIGQQTRRVALERTGYHTSYDNERELRDDETRCPDCGFISRAGTHAELAHDELCDVVLGDEDPEIQAIVMAEAKASVI